MFNKLFLSFILIFRFTCINAQQNDTAFTNTVKLKDDTVKAKRYYNSGFQYVYSKPELSLPLADACEKLSQKLNWLYGVTAADHLRGEYYIKQGDYQKSLDCFFKSLNLAVKIKNRKVIALRYHNIAGVYETLGKYKEAIDYTFKCIKIAQEAKLIVTEAYAYIGLGEIFRQQKNLNKAEYYYKESLKLCIEGKDKKGIASCYNNLGMILGDNGNPQKGIEYHLKALEIKKELQDLYGEGLTYNMTASRYTQMKNYNEAIVYLMKSLEISRKLGDKEGEAENLCNLGENFTELKKIEEAKKYFNEGLKVSEQIGYNKMTQQTYYSLSEIYGGEHNYQKAYLYNKKSSELKDSMLNKESTKQVAEMEAKYENEKKALMIQNLNSERALQKTEIEKKDAEVKRQNTQKIAFAGGFALMLVLAFVVYRGYAHKKKAHKIISLQKHQVEIQKEVIEEKHKEITDSINYAKRIQNALLSSEDIWNEISKEHFIVFRPKDVVSGDFYWSHITEDGKAIWVTADCTGHGVPGAFMSMLGISFLNEIISEKEIKNADGILNSLREKIIKALEQKGAEYQQKDGMDMALCIWDKKKQQLEFAGANNSLYIIRKGELREIKPDKMPIGRLDENITPFSSTVIPLEKNDLIVSFTDGYADQFGGPRGKKFRYKQFEEILLASAELPAVQIKDKLSSSFLQWKGNLEQTDDVCVIGIRV